MCQMADKFMLNRIDSTQQPTLMQFFSRGVVDSLVYAYFNLDNLRIALYYAAAV